MSKKRISLLLLFCMALIAPNLFAQNDAARKERFEKFKAEREAFITKEMDLTKEEAKAFWPLCDELQMKKFEAGKELREESRKMRQARKEGKTITEAEYKKLVQLSVEARLKEAQLDREYIEKFLQVISAEKVYRYQNAEQEFARKSMQERHRERGNRENK